ncbi:MAG: CoA transferase, partial [SAR202 cluster bacterium]|nr:CoA transferase [SAR202 cluster bacterium]
MSSGSRDDETTRALGHLRVLDLAGLEGQYAGKLFADLGADVIKIEPPGGDSTRAMAPFAGDVPDAETSLVFLNYNSNKRSAIVDLDTETGQETLKRLASTADVLIESNRPGY